MHEERQESRKLHKIWREAEIGARRDNDFMKRQGQLIEIEELGGAVCGWRAEISAGKEWFSPAV